MGICIVFVIVFFYLVAFSLSGVAKKEDEYIDAHFLYTKNKEEISHE